MDLLDNLATIFPECKQTATIRKQLQQNREDLDAVKLDWARMIVPFNLQAVQQKKIDTMQYFISIYHNVPRTHMFHQLKLCQKYEAFGDDLDAKETLCGYLVDLERFALTDDVDAYKVEEPTTPISDCDMKTSSPQSRFDDEELTRMCMEKLGDPTIISQAQSIVRNIPELNQLYGNKSNEEIANQMKAMQPILPHLMQIVNVLPIQHIINLVQQTIPDPNANNKHVCSSEKHKFVEKQK